MACTIGLSELASDFTNLLSIDQKYTLENLEKINNTDIILRNQPLNNAMNI